MPTTSCCSALLPASRGRMRGRRNEDYFCAGPPLRVLARADGVVVFARNDVPDQPADPGVVDAKLYETLPNPTLGLDRQYGRHRPRGDGEYSALSHLQKGSVRVEAGHRVRRGEHIGRLGSSGSSELPHLHYQLMAGLRLVPQRRPARPVYQQSRSKPSRRG